MLAKLPSSQRAIQQDDHGQLHVVNEVAIPPLLPGYVLVKTSAVALSPSDYKIAKNFPIPNGYVGSDFSGTVVQVADDVDSVKPGTAVCGSAFTFSPKHRKASGSFAEYVRVRADLLLRLSPSSQLTFSQAATLGVSVATCLMALWCPDALGLSGSPDEPVMSEKPIPVLVYGGSTSVGTLAVQLLKLSGYDPITTCSPHNFDLVRDSGASAVFDYSVSNVVEKIRTYTNGRLKYVLDCISNAYSVTICYAAIQRPGGRYAMLNYVPDKLLAKRRAVHPTFVLSPEIYEEEIPLGYDKYDRPASKEKHELGVRCLGIFQRLLDSGKLKTHPMELLDGGLEGVIKGMDALGRGGVSGKKLVAIIK